MQEKSLPQAKVLAELQERLRVDLRYENGKILSSMCTKPHYFAMKVYPSFLEKNLGDPSLFRGVAKLEKEVVYMIGSLLSNPNACGHIVSGGTEANILAMWVARNLSKREKPEVILPISAHFSFDKAADMLGLRLIKVGLNDRFQANLDAVKRAIGKHTVAIVGTAGTTDLGAIDPIEELSDLAQRHDLYFHVDAAFGGFIIPFLRELGYDRPEFDFKLPGVRSIAIDPHKMGMAPIPAGGILFRDESSMEAISFQLPYLSESGTRQATILGTRSGAPVVAVWALLKHLGRETYRKIAKKCMALTEKLVDDIREIQGIHLLMQPPLNIIGIKPEKVDVRYVADELRKRGWTISLFPSHIRLVTMPHTKVTHIKDFVGDLREVMTMMEKGSKSILASSAV